MAVTYQQERENRLKGYFSMMSKRVDKRLVGFGGTYQSVCREYSGLNEEWKVGWYRQNAHKNAERISEYGFSWMLEI